MLWSDTKSFFVWLISVFFPPRKSTFDAFTSHPFKTTRPLLPLTAKCELFWEKIKKIKSPKRLFVFHESILTCKKSGGGKVEIHSKGVPKNFQPIVCRIQQSFLEMAEAKPFSMNHVKTILLCQKGKKISQFLFNAGSNMSCLCHQILIQPIHQPFNNPEKQF